MKIIELKDIKIRKEFAKYLGIRKWNDVLLAGLGAYEEDVLCGWIIVSIDHTSKTADIESFMVREPFRGKGYGKALFSNLMDILKKSKVKAAMVNLMIPEDVHAAAFFIRKGFLDCIREYPIYHINVETLCAFVAEERKRQHMGEGKLLRKEGVFSRNEASVGKSIVVKAIEELSEQELSDVLDGPAKSFLQFIQRGVDPHFSMAAFKDHKVKAVIMIRRSLMHSPLWQKKGTASEQPEENSWEIAWVGSTSSQAAQDVILLVWKAINRLADELPENATVHTAAVADSAANAIRKVFGDEKWKDRIIASDAMRYIRIFELDDVLGYYMKGDNT